ncbi:hypothetical protein PFICI_09312 [Pestalotiopsis fici W106-1]|uniref:Uncharacterized protein n=1 Tax=Pestalotiopsis fici (strain W106-1 / CGMCC3.15140) TaxID=1229662 RepID=W3X0A7_PESFW|nr:uncharacterized protein PFICI_09312 [Pestalotiopsis fici W106-1]ETS79459.1 hypothetical protein PFICI_09312 [Pestalotiopsis fici W106-1]
MPSTPSNRLRQTPSNSPYLQLPATPRTPSRGRYLPEPRLSLRRVIGTTCASPTGLDTCQSSFAYIAGGAVVVVDVEGETYSQRFYRARPTAIPLYGTTNQGLTQTTPTGTPKANDSRNRIPIPPRESSYGALDRADAPKTWTSRERIKAATCLALSRDGKYLAVGETGYNPRVLIFGLQDSSSDRPLVSINEHVQGVTAVAWSPNTRFLASLGSANDGFLYLWRIDPRTGAAKLYQQNRCVSFIRGMIWMGNNLITLGVRHVKVWQVEDPQSNSPTKSRFGNEVNSPSQPQKALPGRNALLGDLIEATFTCAVTVSDTQAIICSEAGDICLLEENSKQIKLTRILKIGFATTCVAVRHEAIYVSGSSGDFAILNLDQFLQGDLDCITSTSKSDASLLALDFLTDNMVTVDSDQSINIWDASYMPGSGSETSTRAQIAGNGDTTQGVGAIPRSSRSEATFYTWSGSGSIQLWDTQGNIKESFDVALENATFQNDGEPVNQMTACTTTPAADYFITGDKLGVLKVTDAETKQCVFETKAHSSHCQQLAAFQDESNFMIASSGRDRTAQLFHRTSSGRFELFQTLEFPSKVTQVLIPSRDKIITSSLDRSLQVYEIVRKESDGDDLAAFPVRSFPLKTSPTSVVVSPDGKSIIVSLTDRSAYIYDLETGKLVKSFKCTDEVGVESVVLDSLICRPEKEREPPFLLGLSNTDKSVRLYNATTGAFLDREWGHTEGITGVTLVEEKDGSEKVVSVGSDGTIMLWGLGSEEQVTGSASRDPSPAGDVSTAGRAPLRRVRSKADLREFQRPSSVASGRRSSPPQTLTKKRSLYGLTGSAPLRSPTSTFQSSPSTVRGSMHARKTSSDSQVSSPPISPKVRSIRRPSMPAMDSKKTKSSSSLRGAMSLTLATENVCRALREFRKKLESEARVSESALAELDHELRLTSLALGDQAKQSRELSNSVIENILDQYSNKLALMLDEKLQLNSQSSGRQDTPSPDDEHRPNSSGAESLSTATTDSNYSS